MICPLNVPHYNNFYSSFHRGGFGGFGQGSFGSPSSQYGAPAPGNFGGNNQYRGSQNGAFGRNSFVATPSSQYGAPSRSGSFSGAPSSQYGAPSRSSNFGGISSGHNGASSRSGSHAGVPSSQYGTPAQQYNAPSQQYGAPSAFASNTPSAQYGAPNQGGRGGYARGNGYSGDQYDVSLNIITKNNIKISKITNNLLHNN